VNHSNGIWQCSQPSKDLQGGTVKRVKGVEDLNLRIIRAQGIVGVGVIIRMFTA
jgi:hypothetical protein